jgi:hypothetical protein
MKKDIAMRLRKEIFKRERPYPVELLPELNEAADEIELLRSTVTDCRIEIERLRAERDEARREVCQLKGTVRWNHYFPHFDPQGYAENRGWDCFKEKQ